MWLGSGDEGIDMGTTGVRTGRSSRTVLLAVATAIVSCLTLLGAPGIAGAAGSQSAIEAAPGKGLLFQLDCDDLARVTTWIQQRQQVIDGDASVRGSTAWVRATLAAAQAAGNVRRVAHLQKVLDRREKHPQFAGRLLTRVKAAEAAKGC
jgi:hypothetical protein